MKPLLLPLPLLLPPSLLTRAYSFNYLWVSLYCIPFCLRYQIFFRNLFTNYGITSWSGNVIRRNKVFTSDVKRKRHPTQQSLPSRSRDVIRRNKVFHREATKVFHREASKSSIRLPHDASKSSIEKQATINHIFPQPKASKSPHPNASLVFSRQNQQQTAKPFLTQKHQSLPRRQQNFFPQPPQSRPGTGTWDSQSFPHTLLFHTGNSS